MELTPFEYVARKKLRFQTDKGPLTLEQLFDLPLTSDTGKSNLNEAAKSINRVLGSDEQNFVDTATSPVDPSYRIMLDAVKRVIAIRQAENKDASTAREKSARRQELMDALAESERGSLKSKTPDEIRKMIAEL